MNTEQDRKFQMAQNALFEVFGYGRNVFMAMDIIGCIILPPILFILLLMKPENVVEWKMSYYCDSEAYNKNFVETSLWYFSFQTIFSLFLILFTNFAKISAWKRTGIYDCMKGTMIYLIGYLLIYVIWHLFSSSIGMPFPYYFNNKILHEYFCDFKGSQTVTPENLIELDQEMRMSFPSLKMMMLGYNFIYTYLYLDHTNTSPGYRMTETFTFIITSYCSWNTAIVLYQANSHHFVDIIAGFGLGLFIGILSIRHTFGTVFRSEILTFLMKNQSFFEDFLSEEESEDSHSDIENDDPTTPNTSDTDEICYTVTYYY